MFTAETAGVCPPKVFLVGVVGNSFEVTPELGPQVSAAMPQVLERIADLLRQHNVEVRRRSVPLPVNSWVGFGRL